MKTVNIYEYDELSDEAKEKAIQQKIEQIASDPTSMDSIYYDIRKCLHAIVEHFEFKVADYEYGVGCQHADVKLEFLDENQENLSGDKALTWFCDLLEAKGYFIPEFRKDLEFPGVCGFTGMCYDETFLEAIWKKLNEGYGLHMAFRRGLAEAAQKISEEEHEHETSEEYVRSRYEEGIEDGDMFYEDGIIASNTTTNRAT